MLKRRGALSDANQGLCADGISFAMPCVWPAGPFDRQGPKRKLGGEQGASKHRASANAKDTNAKIDAILDALEAMDDAQRGVSRH
jgi:hypothetical protein